MNCLETEVVGAPRVDLVGKPHFYTVFGLLSEPKNDQKWGFPTKSTLGAPTSSPSKQYMSTWMAPYA